MADDILIVPGSGVGAVPVSTEEITTLNGVAVVAKHLQRVALALRTGDGVAVDVPGDQANGLDVDVTREPGAAATGGAVPAAAKYEGINVGGNLRGRTGVAVGGHFASAVAVVDAAGNQITSFGGAVGDVLTHGFVTAATTNAQNIKAAAGKLRSVHVFNKSDLPIYLKFHNTAGVPTAGAGVVFRVGVQAGRERDLVLPGGGRAFATGLAITVVRGIADNDANAVAADDAVIEVGYE